MAEPNLAPGTGGVSAQGQATTSPPRGSPFTPLTRLPSTDSNRSLGQQSNNNSTADSPGSGAGLAFSTPSISSSTATPGRPRVLRRKDSQSSNGGGSGSFSPGATGPGGLGRTSSISARSGLGLHPRTRSSGTTGGNNTPSSGRHISHGAYAASRPAPQPDAAQRDLFSAAVASSNLARSSDGLQALLRDHPELISSSLKAAAGTALMERSESISARASQKGSEPGTPLLESGRGSVCNSLILENSAFPSGASPGGMNLGTPGAKPDYSEQKIVVAMVGLPARGKSYLSNKLMRYLKWLEYDVKVFNVGQMRRALARTKLRESGITEDHTASFFDPANPEAYALRSQMASECLEQLIIWLKAGGNVGIHDATNTTKSRREEIAKRVAQEPNLKLVFLESICTDPAVIAANIAVKVRSGDPDYANVSPEEAKKDFLARIKNYEDAYQPVDADGSESQLSYCKIFDVGQNVVVNQIRGYLESRIAFYLMNLHLTPRNIFFSRHGESQYNVQGKIGGDSDLSERGWSYARALPDLIKDNIGDAPLTVWHSTLKRTAQTSSFLPYNKLAWKSLDELDAGVCDSMTYEEIEQYYPEDYASRDDDKFNYRYRGGESYRDVVVRLEPVIMELERQENILIIGHQAILRCLYAYFHSLSQEELPYIKIPLHTVIQLTPKAYGCDEKRFRLPIDAVDTHRPKPVKVSQVAPGTPPLLQSKTPLIPDDILQAATSLPPSQRKPQYEEHQL
ncbi:bifunctional 6-phosphofructo-2-kinase/fructose-2,6-bisphosphate 2-phosphatase [Tilletiaria anomala UBC 951]|uniref:fructose-2,6-bisphosphate 2-phosphatase n=1 Tax=Tilletiaria anomala (strain ATCC 24038 / CBS 436.72 / UBC 951) TaxID=1037660 RepID=A0A066WGJ8_TILAU|nr:bifunctional 6-phosphofructo-2-kinase/fructose-2,6-bisphosphate 2-phosphatase [Tilletiaria anomala UBC 951]KDN53122.1 bifunctional 6-phosphofructo-2-kinase/fructose-2,6-bisphosphate 2-phosphatase [Tilletiaria anomala UBC 951]